MHLFLTTKEIQKKHSTTFFLSINHAFIRFYLVWLTRYLVKFGGIFYFKENEGNKRICLHTNLCPKRTWLLQTSFYLVRLAPENPVSLTPSTLFFVGKLPARLVAEVLNTAWQQWYSVSLYYLATWCSAR